MEPLRRIVNLEGVLGRRGSPLAFGFSVCRKGTGYSDRAGNVMKNLCGKGTSKSSNELKSGLQSTSHLILMKIYVLSHKITRLAIYG